VSTIRGHRAPAAPGEPATAAVPGDVRPALAPGTPAPTGAGNQPPADQDPRRGRSPATTETAGLGATAAGAGATAAPATAPVEVAAPPAAQPAPPAIQVALHILPLRVAADGIHRLTVHLHPADLGPVSVVAEIRDGEVAVQLAGGTEAGRQALHDALPQLREELTRAGFTNCTLDLRQDAPGQDFRQRTPSDPAHLPAAAPVVAPAESHLRPAVDRNRLLDLRV
jgi:flagellar hook-length control protein FliK